VLGIADEGLAETKNYLLEHINQDWPDFELLLRNICARGLTPMAILPLASCGVLAEDNIQAAVPVAASWEALNYSLRILDDLQDQDRSTALWSRVGSARAFNFSAAYFVLSQELILRSPNSAEQKLLLAQELQRTCMTLLAGQDQDLKGSADSLDKYWLMIEKKNAAAFSWACWAGGVCANQNSKQLPLLRQFGTQLGTLLQLSDDLEGIWGDTEKSDLEQGKCTLPVLYGLYGGHSYGGQVAKIFAQVSLGAEASLQAEGCLQNKLHHERTLELRQLLEKCGAFDFVRDVAQQVNEQAAGVMAQLPDNESSKILSCYLRDITTKISE
jgi:geranylgeranyl diphosphate synthase type I